MLTRGLLMMALAFGPMAAAQHHDNDDHDKAEHVHEMHGAAERHARKADQMLLEGQRLLRDPHFGGNALLQQRQRDADKAYHEARERAERLLRSADAHGPDADAAVADLDTLLVPASLIDSESESFERPVLSKTTTTTPTRAGSTALLAALASADALSAPRSEPSAADLQATLDAPQTTAIRDLATSLGNSPARMHEWVRKNIRFIPTRGSMQGAQGTLETRQGNATDIASLEIALLRSAGVHARYVRGQIEVDAARMQRWLGVDRVEAVSELLSEGGIAFTTAVEAGVPARFTLEHVWVEAWVDMAPSRGFRHVSGDAWVAMDAAFKDRRFEAGPDLLSWLALDADALAIAIDAAAVLDSAAGTLSTLGADAIGALLDAASARLAQALTDRSLSDAELDALLARATDQTPDLPYLMGTHPYRIVSGFAPEAVLPDSERVMFSLDVQIEDNGLPGAPVVSFGQPVVALYGQSLELHFAPATDDDRAILAAMLPSNPSGFVDLPEAVPAYLVEMQGELRLGSTVLLQSPVFGMGRGLYYQVTLTRPDGGRYLQKLRGHVGETRAFVASWNNGVSGELAQTLGALRTQQALLGSDPTAARALASQALRLTGLAHFAAANVYQDWLAGLSRVAWHRSLSLSSSHLALEVEAPFGVVMSARPQGVGLSDVSPLHIGAELQAGNEARFARESLTAQAAFGYQLLEQMYEGGARSATRVFLSSLANNQPVHTLAPEQIAQFDALALPADLHDPLRAGLVGGDHATFTAQPRDVFGWVGYGGQQDYPDARGGTSFIFGKVNPDANAHLTGANVTALKARGLAWSEWLGDALPASVAQAWNVEAESFLAAGDGLVQLSNDPRAIALSPTLSRLIAGTAIHHAVGDRIDPLIDQHLWAQMLWPEISIAPLLDPVPPTLSFDAAPLQITLGESTHVLASVSDNRPGVSLSVSADGQPLALSNGAADYTPTRAGIVPLVARARDAAGNVVTRSLELRVLAPNDASAPLVRIDAPLDDAAVTAPTDVFATISDDSLVRWTLYLRPGNSPTVTPIKLGEGTQAVANARIATLDPTALFNGIYILILEAEDAAGRKTSDSIQVRIDGDMKLGHFSITFVDAEVPLAGIPIRITRTYDTRQAGESLDFGHGWSVDYQNVRVRESRKLGFSWKLAQQGGGFGSWCVKPSGSPVVTVTLPDGKTEQFRAKFSPECTAFVPTVYGQLVFEPVDAKTQSTLEQLDYGTIRWANLSDGRSDLIDLSDPDLAPIDPTNYKLTTEDGTVYQLDQSFGVRAIRDPAGNQISFSANGIVHSSGTSIQFVRDAQHRISAIVLPDGRRLNYEYDSNGDLVAMRDPGDFATRFGYLPNVRYPHYLQDIIDARGVRAARNEYDDDGRLVASIDANGQRTEFVHDIAGHVERVKNRRGFETVYVFDDNGWVLSETNALGEQTVRTYDAYGNELSITDPLDRKTAFVVDPRGNVLQETDPMGAVSRRVWGQFNQLKTETDPLGRVVTSNTYAVNLLTGEETGYLSSTKDALGHITQTPVDICGSTCPNTGNLKGIIDPLGNRTSFEYDRNGNVIRETDALGQVITRRFDAMGRVLSETRTRSVNGQSETLTTTNSYDGKGQLIQTTHPDGAITRTQYDAIGKVIAQTDALGRSTRFEYDAAGRQTGIVHPDGSRESTAYDAEGNVVAQTDRAGRVTRMAYDAANRLVETILPDDTAGDDTDNPRTRNEYDKAGQLLASVDELGHRTTFEYDAAGRQIAIIDALGQRTTHTYDLSGRRLSSTDALGRTVTFGYDLAGKLIETVYPDAVADDGNEANNPRIRFDYDAAGRKVAETDEMGRKTTFAYDGVGRLTGVTLAAHTASPITTTYAYDEQGNKTAQIDALGRRTEWSYDRQGRNLSRKLPLGQAESFAYDSVGQRTAHTTFNGSVMSYGYDALGRIDTINFPDATTRKFSYTPSGQIASIDDRGTAYGFEYDSRDRLIAATDATGRRIDYGYDAAGNRTQLSTPSTTVDYGYDALNRLIDVVANVAGQAADQHTSYAYDAVGNRSAQTHPNGSTVSYQYDRRNRLASLAHHTAAGVLLLGLNYNVDASSLRTGIVETQAQGASIVQTRSASYAYDALKRLTQSSVSGNTSAQTLNETFTYDAVGNRLTRSCVAQVRTCSGGLSTSTSVGTVNTTNTYDANDRLTREQWTASFGATYDYAYDAAGNLLSKKQGTTTLASYVWDIENRLTQATLTPTTASKTISRYQYDPNGIRRVADVLTQTSTTSTRNRTEYLIDPNQAYPQVLEDWTANATQAGIGDPALPDASLQTGYVYGDDLIAQTAYTALAAGALGANAPGDGGNDPLARIGAPTGTRIAHVDGLGSTRLLSAHTLDAAGQPILTGTAQNPANETVTDRYAYSAFGDTDLASSTLVSPNAYRYTGEQLDPNLGWYYLRARYMNPGQGRFVGMDPFVGIALEPSTLHKYNYVSADPTNRIDPSGLFGLIELGSAQNIATQLVLQQVRSSAFDAISNVFVNSLLGGFNGGFNVPRFGSASGAGIVSALALMCEAARSRCLLRGVPTFISGFETPFSTVHVVLAETGNGNTSDDVPQALPFVLVKGLGRNDVKPRRGKKGCPLPGVGLVCDEYPYASTLQGGNVNYRAGLVSLLWVPATEGSKQGNDLKNFYSRAGIIPASPEGIFLNVGIPFLPTSFISRLGKWSKL